MPSGWTRWIFEAFEFPYELVYPRRLNEGDLRKQYDVLIFVTDAIPLSDSDSGDDFAIFGEGPDEEAIPGEFQAWLGEVTVAETVPHLLRFVEEGGTLITVGNSTSMARHAGLPLSDHLVDGEGRPLGEADYYVPGSVLRVRVDNTQPLAYGMPGQLDVFFNNSPVMRLQPQAHTAGVTPVGWFDDDAPLRSGWAWGQNRLKDGIVIAQAQVGQGNLILLGPEVTHRGQPHGTYKLLFNGIHLAGATEVARPPIS